MARATDLSHAEVFKAIEDLLDAGEYPTSARLRERLDNRGSPVVLQRFLSEWYADNGPLLAAARSASPAEAAAVEDRGIRNRLRAVTEEALKVFEQELDRREADLEERVAAANGREAGLNEREARLLGRAEELDLQSVAAASREDGLRREREDALGQLAAAKRSEADMRVELAAVTERLNVAEPEVDRLREAQLDGVALQQALEDANNALALAKERDAAQAAEIKRLTAATGELDATKAAAERALTHASEQVALVERLHDKLDDAITQLERETSRRMAQGEELAAAKVEVAAARNLSERDAAAVKDMQSLRDVALGEVRSLREQLAAHSEDVRGREALQDALQSIDERLNALMAAHERDRDA